MKFLFFLLCCTTLLASEPMNVRVGEPPLDVMLEPITGGEAIPMKQTVADTLSFFLSVHCGHCQTAMETIAEHFVDRFHVIYVFLDPREEVETFLESRDLPAGVAAYLIDPDVLDPYNIRTLPAVLVYRESKLHFAFHGTITDEKMPFLDRHLNNVFGE